MEAEQQAQDAADDGVQHVVERRKDSLRNEREKKPLRHIGGDRDNARRVDAAFCQVAAFHDRSGAGHKTAERLLASEI